MFDLESKKDISLVHLFKERWANSTKDDKPIYDNKETFEFRQLENAINKIIEELPFLFDIKDVVFYKLGANRSYRTIGDDDCIIKKIGKYSNIKIEDFELHYNGDYHFHRYTLNDFMSLFIGRQYQRHIKLELKNINSISLEEEGFEAFIEVRKLFINLDDIGKYEEENSIITNESNSSEANNTIRTEIKEVIKEIEKPQAYLDTNHLNYSSRLAICIDVWNYLFLDGNYDEKLSIKKNIEGWNENTNQQLELSESLMNAMQSILNFDNGVNRTGQMLKDYTPKIQKN